MVPTLAAGKLETAMNSMTAYRRRWPFRFSLRTMLVVVSLLGCWLGWERHIVSRRAGERRAIEKAGGTFYTGEFVPGPFPRRPKPVSWIRRLLGDESVGLIDLRNVPRDPTVVSSWFPEADLCGAAPSDDEESSGARAAQRP